MMSHVPGGLVSKRFLNAWRPVSGAVPPIGGFTLFTGHTSFPAGVVSGDAETARNDFVALITSIVPDPYEDPPWLPFDPGNSYATTSNGNTAIITSVTTLPYINGNNAGRFNTTPAGAQFMEVTAFQSAKFTFGAPMAGFGCFVTDAGDFDAIWIARVVDQFAVSTDYQINVQGTVNGTLDFWGFLDNSGLLYQSVEIIQSTATVDAIGIDDVIIVDLAQIVP